jgi:hypothetical protein
MKIQKIWKNQKHQKSYKIKNIQKIRKFRRLRNSENTENLEHEIKFKRNQLRIQVVSSKDIFQRNLKCRKTHNIPLEELS